MPSRKQTVRLTHLDGKLPNIALMKLAHWHKARGDEVILATTPSPSMFEPPHYDLVYGSAIFEWSAPKARALRQAFPHAVVGGTGVDLSATVETAIGQPNYEHYDYSIYPNYLWSLGFTQRGCRLRCPFCVVPEKEGRPLQLNTIADIWRPGTPRCIMLLDNDFFGQPKDQWQARAKELADGAFRVNFTQGVNIRLLTPEGAETLASLRYSDTRFERPRLYTAWDNLGHEKVFFRGLDLLQRAGIPPKHVMVYMLVGFAKDETMKDVLHRYQKLVDAGCMPYPMVFDRTNRELRDFARWVIGRYHEFVPWEQYLEDDASPNPNIQQQPLPGFKTSQEPIRHDPANTP